MYFYETTLFDTKDGIHWKTQSNDHPKGRVLARPKYVPQDKVKPMGMKSRFLFGKAMTRFNPFAPQPILTKYLAAFKKAYPDYIYWSPTHKRWFFAVPEKNIAKVYDARQGLQEFLRVPEQELDAYLKLTRELIAFLEKSGVKLSSLGILNSTLLGNYTFGKSDIDIVIFGTGNAWKIFDFLETHRHPLMKWKTAAEWRAYYKSHRPLAAHFSENDFVRHSLRKRNEGVFGKHVFTLFCVEKPRVPHEAWDKFQYKSLETASVRGTVSDAQASIVRPATYELENADIPVKKIIVYSLQFLLQAKKGEKIVARGRLEKVKPPHGKSYSQLVIGYPTIGEKKDEGYIKVISH